MRNEFRFAFFGLALGLAVAAMPACTKKCDATTCATGCCGADNVCLGGTTLDACGSGAAACQTCNGGACNSGVCSNGTINKDGGVVTNPVVDAGRMTCATDDDCSTLRNGSVCDTRTGDCVVGRGCNDVSNCQSSDRADPCYQFGGQCLCDKRDAPDTTTAGTCRRRRGPCETCRVDADCGDSAAIYGPPDGIGFGKCRAMTGDTSGAKYCLYQRVGSCKCGTAQDAEGLCRPTNNSCTDVGCRNDKNCPNGSVCTVNLPDSTDTCGGVCKPRCRWDFDARELAMPGCPSGQTCWVDSDNLDAGSLRYGSGRCQTPCSDNSSCAQSATNPWGGSHLTCKGELLKSGGMDAKRCRADGQCMDDFECPVLPTDQPALGYCDLGSRTCKDTCRVGSDPLTGVPYRDCRAPYACSDDTGTPQCKLLNCMQQGGASYACSRSQFCCGEDKDNNGVADPCPPAADRDSVGCYEAPRPPFCQTCMQNSDCASPSLPAWFSGACTNGSKAPSCSLLPAQCVSMGNSPTTGMEVKLCSVASVNDDARIGVSPTSPGRLRYQMGCPQGYDVRFMRHDFAQDGENTCKTDADCNKGTTSGKCELDPDLRLADGGSGLSCRCDAHSGKTQCPNDSANGIATECRVATAGRSYCIETVLCSLQPALVFKPSGAPQYGCGY